jgi:hypothetical protein
MLGRTAWLSLSKTDAEKRRQQKKRTERKGKLEKIGDIYAKQEWSMASTG